MSDSDIPLKLIPAEPIWCGGLRIFCLAMTAALCLLICFMVPLWILRIQPISPDAYNTYVRTTQGYPPLPTTYQTAPDANETLAASLIILVPVLALGLGCLAGVLKGPS